MDRSKKIKHCKGRKLTPMYFQHVANYQIRFMSNESKLEKNRKLSIALKKRWAGYKQEKMEKFRKTIKAVWKRPGYKKNMHLTWLGLPEATRKYIVDKWHAGLMHYLHYEGGFLHISQKLKEYKKNLSPQERIRQNRQRSKKMVRKYEKLIENNLFDDFFKKRKLNTLYAALDTDGRYELRREFSRYIGKYHNKRKGPAIMKTIYVPRKYDPLCIVSDGVVTDPKLLENSECL